ncbi:MAG: hypothetical protein NTZ74_10740, partial [Chloroflexi bacterium]|nr:hypothetical protein [Chloroflexota bacterium]
HSGGGGFYRTGQLSLSDGSGLEIVLYHNEATSKFIYLRRADLDKNVLDIIGLEPGALKNLKEQLLPGQLCLGSDRSQVIGQAINTILGSPSLSPIFKSYEQQNLAVFPIAREGLKYQVAEAIYSNYGFFCDEVVLDAHHVFDSSVPVYNRTVELTLFKDKDLDHQQKENIRVAFLADSIASGLVMKEVIARVSERFENLQHIEIIAPLTTIRGLCRIAQAEATRVHRVRVHVFETLLNALPPDYYYSAHFPDPDFHIKPELENNYRLWWGKDSAGNVIADTACAGYGWSEVFYSPRKQIQMMNSQLSARHGLTIGEIVRRNNEN